MKLLEFNYLKWFSEAINTHDDWIFNQLMLIVLYVQEQFNPLKTLLLKHKYSEMTYKYSECSFKIVHFVFVNMFLHLQHQEEWWFKIEAISQKI